MAITRMLGKLGLLLLVLVGGLGPAGGEPQTERADWAAAGWLGDLERAKARARAQGKPVFIYFDARWCSWCHRYAAETLSQPRVQRVLRAETVPVVLDWDARRDLVHRYGGRGLPFNVLLAPDGRILRAFTGILPPAELIALVRDIPAPEEAAPAAALRPDGLDAAAYDRFRAAYLDHLERLYAPDVGTLAGRFETGVGLKRSQPLAWMWLADQPGWRERVPRARQAAVDRLLDPLDAGFFYYVDPHRPDAHRETAKLLEHNAWMVAWLAGAAERRPRLAAWSGWLFLRHVLWDEAEGGFWRAQVADSDYYAHPPARRLPLPAPPVDRAKLADANAQAALALLQAADRLEQPTMAAYGRRALDFVLAELLHDGHLYHSRQGGQRSVADLPADLFWVLWAGDAVQARAPEAERGERLAVVAGRAADWLRQRMAEGNEGDPPRTEVIALAARVCSRRERYPALPEGCRDWALRRLALRPETRPDWLIPGLRAWEGRLKAGT